MKGDSSMTVADLKSIIRAANKPNSMRAGANLKLTGSKKELQDRLKSVGRWREIKSSPKKSPVKKAVKKAPVKKAVKKAPASKKTYEIDLNSEYADWSFMDMLKKTGWDIVNYTGYMTNIPNMRTYRRKMSDSAWKEFVNKYRYNDLMETSYGFVDL